MHRDSDRDNAYSPTTALRSARTIAFALLAGVTSFAGIALLIAADRDAPPAGDADALLIAWLALAFAALLGAILFWRAAVAPHLDRREDPTHPPHGTPAAPHGQPHRPPAALQSGLVISWAILEAPALLGVVLYFLTGSTPALVGGLAIIWVGIGLTWPREEWFRA